MSRADHASHATMTITDLRSALEAVVSTGGDIDRLGRAGTSVAFHVDGGSHRSLTLLLDRRPCVVVDLEPAEIDIHLTSAQAEAMAVGALPLPSAIAAGDVLTHGPVRRFLVVEPVLRGALAANAGPDRMAPPVPTRATGAIDPDLLAIETRGLKKAFGTNAVLQGLDIAVPEGSISVVLGPSGTGKSVLLQHVIGLVKPDSGDVLIRGQKLGDMSRHDILTLRRRIGVMFQDGALFSTMSVFDNVAFPLRQHTSLDDRQVHEIVDRHLADVGLAGAAGRMPSELSGGMRKRAGLARALVLNPSIVLCDEPDSGLDPVRTALLADLLVEQHALHGGAMIVVTHNVSLARRVADHVSVLWRGKVLESGLAADVFASETAFVQQFLAGEADGPLGMDQ